MRRGSSLLLAIGIAATFVGCSLCASPYDYCYPVVDQWPGPGRAGSIMGDRSGAPVGEQSEEQAAPAQGQPMNPARRSPKTFRRELRPTRELTRRIRATIQRLTARSFNQFRCAPCNKLSGNTLAQRDGVGRRCMARGLKALTAIVRQNHAVELHLPVS